MGARVEPRRTPHPEIGDDFTEIGDELTEISDELTEIDGSRAAIRWPWFDLSAPIVKQIAAESSPVPVVVSDSHDCTCRRNVRARPRGGPPAHVRDHFP